VVSALEVAGELLQENREYAQQRQRVITTNAELQERESIKLASLATAIARALRERGVGAVAASLAGETGIAIFKIAFERWVDETNELDLPALVRDSLVELSAMTSAERTPQPARLT
jgi:hypothetical protein